jgi:N-acetylglucosaminyldiphosphoundecaprenol N-acetyl-beta-D-mannosaminyltransferase
MKKITILALHLSTGGVEMAIANLSNILIKKYDVEIISTYKMNENPAFNIDDKVKIKYLMTDLKPNHKEIKDAIKSKNILKIIKEGFISLKVLYLRRKLMIKAIKNLDCDIAISTRYLHSNWLGKYGSKNIIKIAQEHNHHNNDRKYINKVIKSLKNIDYFIPVSNELYKFYSEKLKNTKTKCMCIKNSLDKYPKETSNLTSKNIISVGRLSPEKGFLDLIDVFKLVNEKFPDWKLNIAGDGEQKTILQNKIRELNLENNVKLLGFLNKQDLEKLYYNSSIYVMTSYTESFGLVLIEANSYGIPTISFDTAQGANEIIGEGKNGYLIKNRNKEDMSNKIIELIEDYEKRCELGKNARIMSEEYKEENVAFIWYNLIDNT